MSSKLSYLQKYLSSGEALKTPDGEETKKKKKKKKDKKSGSHGGGFKIIDDDGFGAAAVKEKEKSKKNVAKKYVDRGERPRLKEVTKRENDDGDSDEDELSYATLEDRPQIAGFVDERPEVEIMKERRFTTSTFKVGWCC